MVMGNGMENRSNDMSYTTTGVVKIDSSSSSVTMKNSASKDVGWMAKTTTLIVNNMREFETIHEDVELTFQSDSEESNQDDAPPEPSTAVGGAAAAAAMLELWRRRRDEALALHHRTLHPTVEQNQKDVLSANDCSMNSALVSTQDPKQPEDDEKDENTKRMDLTLASTKTQEKQDVDSKGENEDEDLEAWLQQQVHHSGWIVYRALSRHVVNVRRHQAVSTIARAWRAYHLQRRLQTKSNVGHENQDETTRKTAVPERQQRQDAAAIICRALRCFRAQQVSKRALALKRYQRRQATFAMRKAKRREAAAHTIYRALVRFQEKRVWEKQHGKPASDSLRYSPSPFNSTSAPDSPKPEPSPNEQNDSTSMTISNSYLLSLPQDSGPSGNEAGPSSPVRSLPTSSPPSSPTCPYPLDLEHSPTSSPTRSPGQKMHHRILSIHRDMRVLEQERLQHTAQATAVIQKCFRAFSIRRKTLDYLKQERRHHVVDAGKQRFRATVRRQRQRVLGQRKMKKSCPPPPPPPPLHTSLAPSWPTCTRRQGQEQEKRIKQDSNLLERYSQSLSSVHNYARFNFTRQANEHQQSPRSVLFG